MRQTSKRKGRRTGRAPAPGLRTLLEELVSGIGPDFLDTDPIQIPHRYADSSDREVAALVASSLAFGNVASILASVETVLTALGPNPASGLRALTLEAMRAASPPGWLRGPLHRWVQGSDMERFLVAVGALRDEEGSLGQAFRQGIRPQDEDIGPALAVFVERLRRLDPARGAARTRGLDTLLCSPLSGSACKRWCLFLRWCARPADGIDLGLWEDVPPRLLVLPLDVHLARLARTLRLTRRRTVDWKAAQEATATLRRFSPEDPVRYDFALCRLGMLGTRSLPGLARRPRRD